jgi:hypothetical protein
MTSIKARSRIRNAARHLGYERLGIRVHTQQTVVADRTFILGYVEPEDWQKWQNSEV